MWYAANKQMGSGIKIPRSDFFGRVRVSLLLDDLLR